VISKADEGLELAGERFQNKLVDKGGGGGGRWVYDSKAHIKRELISIIPEGAASKREHETKKNTYRRQTGQEAPVKTANESRPSEFTRLSTLI